MSDNSIAPPSSASAVSFPPSSTFSFLSSPSSSAPPSKPPPGLRLPLSLSSAQLPLLPHPPSMQYPQHSLLVTPSPSRPSSQHSFHITPSSPPPCSLITPTWSSYAAALTSPPFASSASSAYMFNYCPSPGKRPLAVAPSSSSPASPLPPSSPRSPFAATPLPSSPSTSNKSLLPQNLRGDPFRKAKVKTEMCLHFTRKGVCPFGDSCNFAHGEVDLKYHCLMDMQRAGLADAEVRISSRSAGLCSILNLWRSYY